MKNKSDQTKEKRHSKKLLIFIALILILIPVLIFVIISSSKKSEFDEQTSKLIYSENRAHPTYSINQINESNEYITFKVIYSSKSFMGQESRIYGLLYVPANKTSNIPGMVFLPGGGVAKEDEPAAPAIAKLGYAVLVIDQRGIGETGGFYPNYEQDKLIFEDRQESIQHLGVYDALLAIDVLKDLDYIDENNIFIGGASMGGRYAMIAASLDSNIKKAIIISSSGFHVEYTNFKNDPYFLSIDPDRYVKDISPNKLVMIHSTTDTMINIDEAKYTFSLANEPKSFYIVENCEHGYCDKMLPFLEKELIQEK